MQEWAASRANAHFSEHWIVALREHHDHHDHYNNKVLSATPSRHERELKPCHWNTELRGLDAAQQLQAFDRAAGYPGAWYFHLVAGGLTPRDMAFAAMQDIESGFGYLGDAETALLTGWLGGAVFGVRQRLSVVDVGWAERSVPNIARYDVGHAALPRFARHCPTYSSQQSSAQLRQLANQDRD